MKISKITKHIIWVFWTNFILDFPELFDVRVSDEWILFLLKFDVENFLSFGILWSEESNKN